eukprot:6442421-Amphidinium_carterae.1
MVLICGKTYRRDQVTPHLHMCAVSGADASWDTSKVVATHVTLLPNSSQVDFTVHAFDNAMHPVSFDQCAHAYHTLSMGHWLKYLMPYDIVDAQASIGSGLIGPRLHDKRTAASQRLILTCSVQFGTRTPGCSGFVT